MSLEIKGLMLWHETNYCGHGVRGKVTKKIHQHRLPVALRPVPRLFLDFGDAKSKPRRKEKRISFTENHFDKEKPHDIIWDLYFDKIQFDNEARFVLVPRGVFDWYQPIYPEAVGCLGWKYAGEIESSTFRWDLYMILSDFFATSKLPHCSIEAFLPSLLDPQSIERPVNPQTNTVSSSSSSRSKPKREKKAPSEIVCSENGLVPEITRKNPKRGLRGTLKTKDKMVGVQTSSEEIFAQ